MPDALLKEDTMTQAVIAHLSLFLNLIGTEETDHEVNENMKAKGQRIKADGCLDHFHLSTAQNICKFNKRPEHRKP